MNARGGPVTQEAVRRQNLAAVLEHLHLNGATTRSALTSLLAVNRSTVGALVSDLEARGLVYEVESPVRGTGRPSPTVQLREQRVVALAVEIEVDSISAAVIGLGGSVIAEKHLPHLGGKGARSRDVSDVVGRVATISHALLDVLPPQSVVAGVGIGVAGIVRNNDGLVHHAPNLGWRNVPLGEEVNAALGLDVPVHVGNDAALGAIAEHTRGAARDVHDLVFISSEIGVGLGAIADDRLLTGADGYFGEFGHLPLFPRGRECRCGLRGCWETEVGALALLRRAGRSTEEGLAGVRAVIEAAAAGDRAARAAVGAVSDRLARGLAVAVNALNPRMVVLGGFFAEMWPLARDRTLAGLSRTALPVTLRSVEIVPSAIGTDVVLVGAAETAMSQVLSNPMLVPVVEAASR